MFRPSCVVTVAALLAAGTGVPRAHAQDREFTRTVDLQASGTLRVEGSKGSIQLTSWDKPQVEIHARIELPRHEPREYAQRAVDATQIDVIAGTGSVSIRSNYDQVP